VLHTISEVVQTTPEWARTAPGSIKKDVDCVLRMYAPAKAKGREGLEGLLDCPFRELGLLEPVPDETRTYRWVYGRKPTLPPSIVAYAAIDFALREGTGATVTLTRLATAQGGPGRAFKLPEQVLHEALVEGCAGVDGVEVASQGGIRQLVIRREDPDIAACALESYYKRTAGSARKLSDRPIIEVFREYEHVLADLEIERDKLRDLDLRQRRIKLHDELAAAGLRL